MTPSPYSAARPSARLRERRARTIPNSTGSMLLNRSEKAPQLGVPCFRSMNPSKKFFLILPYSTVSVHVSPPDMTVRRSGHEHFVKIMPHSVAAPGIGDAIENVR